jgi:Barstar (barnase inhibitor)
MTEMNINNYSSEHSFVALIDCHLCCDKETLFSELQQKLNFPDYFGTNWDALRDVMCDFSWLGEKRIVCLFLDSELLLQNNEEDKAVFKSILYESKIELTQFDVKLDWFMLD